MFGEVLLALDGAVTAASRDGEGGVSQGGEGLGGVAGSGAAGVLAAGPIAGVVQAVLDSPMPSRDVEQGGGVGALARQAGDGVHDLDAVLAAQAASSLDAADLAQTRPLAEIGGEALAALQASDLDAAVPLLDRLDPSHVRRGLSRPGSALSCVAALIGFPIRFGPLRITGAAWRMREQVGGIGLCAGENDGLITAHELAKALRSMEGNLQPIIIHITNDPDPEIKNTTQPARPGG